MFLRNGFSIGGHDLVTRLFSGNTCLTTCKLLNKDPHIKECRQHLSAVHSNHSISEPESFRFWNVSRNFDVLYWGSTVERQVPTAPAYEDRLWFTLATLALVKKG